MPDLLLCTLGGSWAVIPETLAFLDPQRLPLYARHPQADELAAERTRAGLHAPHEVWIVTTQGRQTQQSLHWLAEWREALGARAPLLRVWQAQGTDQLATATECAALRELTLRLVLRAHEVAAGGQVVLSLAGGRKTMSADLQRAATVFGCTALLHVVDAGLPRLFIDRDRQAEVVRLMLEPLPATLAETGRDGQTIDRPLAGAIRPLLADGRLPRAELLDIALDERRGPVSGARFPLPPAAAFGRDAPPCAWAVDDAVRLGDELAEREREGSRLLGNYLGLLARDEKHENWRQLYRLPPARIDALRTQALGADNHNWLAGLPKADLHRHLGGCLDLTQQIAVGRAVWDALDAKAVAAAFDGVGRWIGGDWPADWPERLKDSDAVQRTARVAALLAHESAGRLAGWLYPQGVERVGLKHGPGFAAYERPGELTGSAILQHPAAIAPYAAALVAQARAEGLAYVELRGSPHKYLDADGLGFLRQLRQALDAAGAHTGAVDAAVAQAAVCEGDRRRPLMRFIVIADRRAPERAADVADLVMGARRELDGFVVGVDLAGDEAVSHLDRFAEDFAPLFRDCVPVTIHAGEGEDAENIWQAAYELHADRIGHGLTLIEKPGLAARFRNRGIAVELCPTSNREVVGYRDPDVPASAGWPGYPLRRLLDAGLPLAICTDNPGISRTTLVGEFLAAARMGGGLSRWEALALIRQGFVHAFLPAEEREHLLKAADAEIYRRLAGAD